MDKQHIAILVFVRSAAEEAERKPLAESKKQSQKIAELLNQRIIREAKKTNIPTYVIDESLQKGSDFGSRFDSAWRYVFEQGFEQVIAIGNDCLEVTTEQLNQAADQLKEKKVVIGPTQDGGFYLLGLHRAVFENLDLIHLPWQTSGLYQTLLDSFNAQKQIVQVLSLAIDIDHQGTLELVLRRLPKNVWLKQYLFNLLRLSKIESVDEIIKDQVYLCLSQQRGPPFNLAI